MFRLFDPLTPDEPMLRIPRAANPFTSDRDQERAYALSVKLNEARRKLPEQPAKRIAA